MADHIVANQEEDIFTDSPAKEVLTEPQIQILESNIKRKHSQLLLE